AEEVGAIPALARTLIEIETTVDGLDSVYNRYDLTTGRNEETDTELRQRYLESLSVTGVGTLDAIVAAVKRVQGVSDASG
ncbi:baseplate J/gp47 family protein, partial [Salmonella enterica]|uniref:baseplate J/gp47 family protein n=1 Tax=Salmonella enterica TaxID=28901 RepID=UPI0020C202E3